MVKDIRRRSQVPICLMTYFNPVFAFGQEKFIKEALASGVDGVIIPDLPPEEGQDFIQSAHKSKLDVICFISPTTSLSRIEYIARVSRGFIYYVSLTGVTGVRRALPQGLLLQLKNIKRVTAKPVCVGFGVSNVAQIARINKVADGVIIGSAIIKKIKENLSQPDLVKRVVSFIQSLKEGRS